MSYLVATNVMTGSADLVQTELVLSTLIGRPFSNDRTESWSLPTLCLTKR